MSFLEVVIDNFKLKIICFFKRKNEYWVKFIIEDGEYIMKFKSFLEVEDVIYGMFDDF